MNSSKLGRFTACLPLLVLGAYWLYKGLLCGILTHDQRLLKLSVVSAPVAAAVLYGIFKIVSRKETGVPD